MNLLVRAPLRSSLGPLRLKSHLLPPQNHWCRPRSGSNRLPSTRMVYTVVAHLHAKEGADVEQKIRSTLTEASQVYSKDKETLSWLVMQDTKDPRAWCIIERYEQESSLEEHRANPYHKTFAPAIVQLLDQPFQLYRFNELDTSKPVKDEEEYCLHSPKSKQQVAH
ncbi:hypothetical protein DFH07DRAFT_796793 [Mycena maculata]|uniref:ABM domain-containing protein n=1 Tax=Mycena maculata TaxID=230809 RepID=A0AAD7NVT0_9AGAR|nr:hypothetical protein DFH07DRAFT_796793 [Mycena maculata]